MSTLTNMAGLLRFAQVVHPLAFGPIARGGIVSSLSFVDGTGKLKLYHRFIYSVCYDRISVYPARVSNLS
jgi:hypothetical protein